MKPPSILGIITVLLIALAGCAGNSPRPDFSDLPRDAGRSSTPVQKEVIRTAHSLLGTPYKYGGTTPEGFDCSGFVNYVYRKAAGVALPRETHDLVRAGRPVLVAELRPADLVYFKIEHQKPLHVGIYLGEGKFIHSPSTRGKINIQRLDQEYWRDRYLGARRLL
ncbi:MAG: C40 family peptidase [Nitrospirae bacterium]|nr:C40 family peptidase [Nitrospirota bacterium]